MRNASIVYLVDTNVLVYAYDGRDRYKQARAVDVLDRLARAGTGAFSAQVLAEFFVAATRRIVPPLRPDEAEQSIERYLGSWRIVPVTGPIVLEAARGVREHRLSFWDALVWATARLHGVPILLTEDVPGRTPIEGVRYMNPFGQDFDVRRL